MAGSNSARRIVLGRHNTQRTRSRKEVEESMTALEWFGIGYGIVAIITLGITLGIAWRVEPEAMVPFAAALWPFALLILPLSILGWWIAGKVKL